MPARVWPGRIRSTGVLAPDAEVVVKICVVGAGVGGVALAQGLLADGHRVELFERGTGPAPGGAAVTIYSNGAAALAGLGVSLDGLGAEIEELRLRRSDGRALVCFDLTVMQRRTGYAIRTIARADLVARLASGLPAEALHYSSSVRSVSVGDGSATLVLDSGDQHAAQVLVGADGHRSVVRRDVLDPQPARAVGWATWQGLTEILPQCARGAAGQLVVGPAGLVGLMPAGRGLLQWWFDIRWDGTDLEPGSALARLREAFGRYADPVPALLEAITAADLGLYPHVLHQVPQVWGRGNSTLLGDAAHAFPPSQAQGANQALEDAWLLRRALQSSGDPAAALRRYERRRTPRVRRVARMAASERTNRPPSAALGLLARLVAAARRPCQHPADLPLQQRPEQRAAMSAAERILVRVSLSLVAIAVSLAVASALHLSGQVDGRGPLFDADHAGIAEALIAVVLVAAAVALWRIGARARRAALWATGCAIAGFCWGLSITARAGHWPDIGYHVAVLPLLVVGFAALRRAGRVASAP